MTTARRTALYENSFTPSAVDCWNNLHEHLRNSLSISCFKRIINFQQAKLHYTSSTVHVFYQLYMPVLETSLVILKATYLIIMFPLQINAKCVTKLKMQNILFSNVEDIIITV